VDREGMIRCANPAARSLWRRGPEEIVGMPFGVPVVVGETVEIDLLRTKETVVVDMRAVETEWQGESAFLISLRDVTRRC